ncbi:MAG: hypothetical protein K9I85_01345 [Saprospiraceae bacterium]|nr:hypothetical protein [Saprospiraceae bacterium]
MKKLLLLLVFAGLATVTYSQSYSRAIGLRLGWDYGISYKHFLNQKAALEGVLTYRSWGDAGYNYNYFRLTGLYLIHNPIEGAEGLSWYYGAGVSIQSWGGQYKEFSKYLGKNYSSVALGIHGALGLDYKFVNAPINLTLDWVPSFVFGGWGSGFGAEVGGLGVRYTF